MKYRALVDLFYPVSAMTIRALERGDNIPLRKRNMKHVPAGTIVEDVPAASVAELLATGRIELVSNDKEE